MLRARDEWGYTPAHWAALDGNVDLMRFFIDKGAPIDLPCLGTQGPRPIHWACRKGLCLTHCKKTIKNIFIRPLCSGPSVAPSGGDS